MTLILCGSYRLTRVFEMWVLFLAAHAQLVTVDVYDRVQFLIITLSEYSK